MQLYDPELRRDTPLARKLVERIRTDGPMAVHDYMDACLNDPECGYYRTRTAIGRTGDFITAPEISQVFGELIGLWCAVVWQQMGQPQRFNLIELGAGRGTLLADVLRAVRLVPGFREAVSVHIVDANPVLIEMQKAALKASGVAATWHATLDTLPADAPSIWVANEFLDTVPVEQWERRGGRWHVRAVGVDAAGRLAFVPAPREWLQCASDAMLPAHGRAATWADGDVYEHQHWAAAILQWVQRLAGTMSLAALLIDYGYTGFAKIDSLQAVREHRPEHVLTSPGEADLSCQVDFEDFALMTAQPMNRHVPLAVDGPVTQSEFLGALGIMERASRLMAKNPGQANMLEMGVARLMAPHGMGTRFKAIGVRSPHLPPLPGF